MKSKEVIIPCLICGTSSDRVLRVVEGFRIVQCAHCRFIFVNPRPTEDSLSKLYDGSKQNIYFAERYEAFEHELPVLHKIVRKIRKLVPSGELLEVGCGRGDLLRVAQMYGFSVAGCDMFGGETPSLQGARFYDGTLEQVKIPANSFDIVVIRNVLEHLFDPNRALNEVRRILKPNGHLYLKVPNADFEYGLLCRMVFGKAHAFEPPYHLNHFTPPSLKRLLSKAEFKFLSWNLEQPTLSSKRFSNFLRQTGYRVIGTMYYSTLGLMFPKIVLACVVQKQQGRPN